MRDDERSLRPEVRNPLLQLEEMHELIAFLREHPELQKRFSKLIRNPLLQLEEMHELIAFLREHPELQKRFSKLIRAIARVGRSKAQSSWRQNKAPMAVYWKGIGVYAGHTHRAVRQ